MQKGIREGERVRRKKGTSQTRPGAGSEAGRQRAAAAGESVGCARAAEGRPVGQTTSGGSGMACIVTCGQPHFVLRSKPSPTSVPKFMDGLAAGRGGVE